MHKVDIAGILQYFRVYMENGKNISVKLESDQLIEKHEKFYWLQWQINKDITKMLYEIDIIGIDNDCIVYKTKNISIPCKTEYNKPPPEITFIKDNIEILFSSGGGDNDKQLSYKFFSLDKLNKIFRRESYRITFSVRNISSKEGTFYFNLNLQGFKENNEVRKYTKLQPGQEINDSFYLTPHSNSEKYGIIRIIVYSNEGLSETSDDITIKFIDKSPTINRCFKLGINYCPLDIKHNDNQVFIGMPFRDEYEDAYQFGILPAIQQVGLIPWKANEAMHNMDIMCKVCQAIQESKFAIIDVSSWNPNVMFELGLVYGIGKPALLINKESKTPTDLLGMEYIEYKRYDELREKCKKHITKIISND